ncbi:MAG: hypothetical protein ACPIOQ_56930, partial [Promethearchaeia archaeon]
MPTLSGLRLAIRAQQSIDSLLEAFIAVLPKLPNLDPRLSGWDAGVRPGSSPHGRTRALSGARHVWFESGEDPLGLEVPISRVYGDVADDLSEAHIIASFYPPVRLMGQLMEAIAQHMPSLTSIVLDLQVFSVFVHHVVVLDLLGSSPLYYGYDGLVWNVTTNVSYGDTRYINFADLPRGDNSWQG